MKYNLSIGHCERRLLDHHSAMRLYCSSTVCRHHGLTAVVSVLGASTTPVLVTHGTGYKHQPNRNPERKTVGSVGKQQYLATATVWNALKDKGNPTQNTTWTCMLPLKMASMHRNIYGCHFAFISSFSCASLGLFYCTCNICDIFLHFSKRLVSPW